MKIISEEEILILKNKTKCCICGLISKNPRYLSCFHSACSSCIENLIINNEKEIICKQFIIKNKKENEKNDIKEIEEEIILCEQITNLKELNLNSVEKFPIDFEKIKNIKIFNEFEKQNENENKIIFCIHCEEENKKAFYFCSECEENYCEEHSNFHKKQKISKNHSIINLREINKINFNILNCFKHSNLNLNYFCKIVIFQFVRLFCKEHNGHVN